MKGSGIVLATLVSLSSAALVYHRANTASEAQWVSYNSGEEQVRSYLALPEGQGPFPAVIVIHEWWGLNDWVQQNTKRLAREGYAALAIDLYRGSVTSDPEGAHELMRGLPEDRAIRDLRAAFEYLAGRSDVKKDRIGSLGWCMGGGYSLQAAVQLPDLAACVVNYGRLVTDENLIAQINAPILGVFGGLDRGIPVKDVQAFAKQAKNLGKEIRLEVYSKSGHAFINENNAKGYNAEDAMDAWKKTLAFLAGHLKQ
ncbi:MAG: dienelactone hydrolase family protein [candidate division KSB1 bacterium]